MLEIRVVCSLIIIGFPFHSLERPIVVDNCHQKKNGFTYIGWFTLGFLLANIIPIGTQYSATRFRLDRKIEMERIIQEVTYKTLVHRSSLFIRSITINLLE